MKRNSRRLKSPARGRIFSAPGAKSRLEKILPGYLKNCRWFGGKARKVRAVTLADSVSIPFDSDAAYMTVVEVNYRDGEPESYLLPLTFVSANGPRNRVRLRRRPSSPGSKCGGGGNRRWDPFRCAL